MELRRGYKQTEVGVIPEDWVIAVLKDIVDNNRQIRYGIVQPGKFDHNGRFMVRGQDYSFGWVDASRFFKVSEPIELRYKNARLRGGDVIITIVGASTGHVEIVPSWLDGANLTQTTARISIDRRMADNIYCRYYLQSTSGQSQIANFIKGAAQPGLNCGDVEILQIPLPPTKAEQEAIAEALSDADALIQSLEKLIAKKRLIKQGAMQELLRPKKGWVTKSMGDCFSFSGGYSASRDQLSTEGFCYLHYGDIHGTEKTCLDAKEDYERIPRLPISLKRVSRKSLLNDGDVVFVDASEDDEGTSRHVVIKNTEGTPFISGLHTIVAKSKNDDITHLFKQYCFQTSHIKGQFKFYSVGTKVSGISKTNIAKLDLRIPSDRDEQTRIANILSDMDAEITTLETKLGKYKKIKRGMMQELLTGKTRLI